MPIIRIETNVPQVKIPDNLPTNITNVVSKTMGKDAKWFAVTITTTSNITFQGSTEPCALIDLTSIGSLGVQENKAISQVLTEVITKGLGIEPTRMYICFHDLKTNEIGYNGTTFYEIFGK